MYNEIYLLYHRDTPHHTHLRHLHQPCRQLRTKQIQGQNALSNKDKDVIALSNQESKNLDVYTQELAQLVGKKNYNKGTNVATEIIVAHPIRSNTSTTGTTSERVATTSKTTTQVVLVYDLRMCIDNL